MILSFEHILRRIEKEVAQLRFDDPPPGLYDPVKYALSTGGKRIRPALTLIACNMYSDSIEEAVQPALGLEVFHNFTLLHDDLMDNAGKRRNKPTVHKRWNANTAILSGDAMLIAAYRLIGSTPSGHLKEVLDLFTRTALEICGGQQYDMEFESRRDVEEKEYLEMIRLKTAVLLACCLETGAMIGGASREDAGRLYAFGINMGLAFQLQDDLLDVYGDTAAFGKNTGGDILCNKKTFLLVSALKQASREQRAVLNRWMDEISFNPSEKIAAFTHIYNELRLKEQTELKIQAYYDSAFTQLNALEASPERKETLKSAGNLFMRRQS
jgi:geranylgeranyl diphosphate synthase type II